MSVRAIPLLLIVFVFYNVIVLFGGDADPNIALRKEVFGITLPNGKFPWSFSRGDLVILLLLVTLFFEILKSTYTSSASMLDHGLSMLVFVACLIEFLMISQAQTSTFFFITVATLIDVVAGYTIGIRVARRDLSIGG